MKYLRMSQSALTAAVVLALASLLAGAQNKAASTVTIENFGKVSDYYYRGARPNQEQMKELSILGIKTVINLERDGWDDEQSIVESLGMKYRQIGMSNRRRPKPEQVAEFLQIVKDPASYPVYVHCRGGRHRTGMLTAIYRIIENGWTAERAYEEMKQYKFETGFGHGPLKSYVFDYYTHRTQNGGAVNQGAPAVSK